MPVTDLNCGTLSIRLLEIAISVYVLVAITILQILSLIIFDKIQ